MRRYLPPEIQPVISYWESRRPSFLWAPTTADTWLKDRAKGVTARVQGSAGAIEAGGIPKVIANSADSYLTFPTNCGIGGGSSPMIGAMLVEVLDPTAVTGAFLKIGDSTGGLGFGGGNTTFENSGSTIIFLQEAVRWVVGGSSAFARGLNTIIFGTDNGTNVIVWLNLTTGASAVSATSGDANATVAPSADLQINGYFTNRGSNARVAAVAIYAGTSYSNDLATALGRPALQFSRRQDSRALFTPTQKRIWVPGAAPSGTPTLSAALLVNLAATTATPRVTLTF